MDVEAQYTLLPKGQRYEGDILFNDIDYFPYFVEFSYKKQRSLALNSLSKVQKEQPYLTAVVDEILLRYDFFWDCLHQISNGINPGRQTSFLKKESKYLTYISEIDYIETNSPKSYQLLKKIEKLFFSMSYALKKIVSESNSNTFKYGVLPSSNELKGLINQLSDENFKKIPFAQLVLSLANCLLIIFNVLREICVDNSSSVDFNLWSNGIINVSEGGAKLKIFKRFKMGMPSVLKIIFDDGKKLNLESRVVSTFPSEEKDFEYVSLNFDFPEAKEQLIIKKRIQTMEINKTLAELQNARY